MHSDDAHIHLKFLKIDIPEMDLFIPTRHVCSDCVLLIRATSSLIFGRFGAICVLWVKYLDLSGVLVPEAPTLSFEL
jgi:hypothetical protein